jgi:hypothetical protein
MRESNGAFVGGSFVEWISKVKLYVPNFFSQILKQTNLVGFAFFNLIIVFSLFSNIFYFYINFNHSCY